MIKNSPTMWQYNGLVLLTGYLRRLDANDQILRLLGLSTHPGRGAALPSLLHTVTTALAAMEQEPLPVAQQRAIAQMLPQVEAWWEASAPRPRYETNLAERVAAAAAAIYGEKQINDGLITMGRLFAPSQQERFVQQALLHQGRLQVVSTVVGCLSRQRFPPQPELGYMERWYDELYLRRDGIQADLSTVARLLEGQKPAVRSA